MVAGPVLALDIGGTKLAAGVVSPEGEVIAEGTAATEPTALPAEVSEALFRLAEEVLRLAGLAFGDLPAAGISFGGPVNYEAGTVVTCHHLAGWEGVPFRDIVSERTGIRAVMDNDANAAALGETVFGAARGCQHVLYVTVSTGIGGGLVLGGRVHRGLNSMAGEIGHTHLVPYGRPGAPAAAWAAWSRLPRAGRWHATRERRSTAARLRLSARFRMRRFRRDMSQKWLRRTRWRRGSWAGQGNTWGWGLRGRLRSSAPRSW